MGPSPRRAYGLAPPGYKQKARTGLSVAPPTGIIEGAVQQGCDDRPKSKTPPAAHGRFLRFHGTRYHRTSTPIFLRMAPSGRFLDSRRAVKGPFVQGFACRWGMTSSEKHG